VVDICRRLDGLPLAIELAAARVELFGLRDLAARLDDRLGLLTRGRRTAAARHQTLRATLDWSYDILPPAEQTALCRLAVFSGPFDLPSARQVLVGGEIAESAALDLLTNLAAKSLLSVHTTGQQVLYRLLDTSRAYALEKLDASQESSEIRRRHAVLCCAKAQTGPDWERRSSTDALVGQGLEEVRAALRWCFSPKGDPSLGVSLTAASAPSWFQSPFLGEYRKHIQHALAVLPRTPESNFALELQLNAALGDAMLYTVGPNPSITVAFTRTLELAEQLGITVHRRRALSGLCIGRIAAGDYHSAVGFAQALHLCVEDSPDQTSPASRDWLVALAHHLCGQQLHARQHIERALLRPLDSTATWSDRPFHFAPRVASHGILARILWIQGFPEQAACSARRSLAYAQGADHPLSLCYALSVCAAMALYAGETQHVGRLLARLLHLANRHGLSEWLYWARCLELALAHCQGGSTGGAPGMPDPLHCCWHQEILATFHPQLATAATLLRAESGLSGWATAELLRIRAEQLLAQPAQDTLTAETVLWEAIESARNQGALAWELRAATSLASLWRQQGRVHEARDLLLSVYCKFQEGFATADLVRAKALLEQLPLRSSSPILTHSPACALNRS
jgi:predicted ATPase